MGREEQRERERKKAAKGSHALSGFGFLPKKRSWSDGDLNVTATSQRQLVEEVWDFQPDDATVSIALDRDKAKSTSSASVLKSHLENDIGALFQNPSPEECQKVVDELTDGEKYSLLKHHRRSPAKLPTCSDGLFCRCSIVKKSVLVCTWYKKTFLGGFILVGSTFSGCVR